MATPENRFDMQDARNDRLSASYSKPTYGQDRSFAGSQSARTPNNLSVPGGGGYQPDARKTTSGLGTGSRLIGSPQEYNPANSARGPPTPTGRDGK